MNFKEFAKAMQLIEDDRNIGMDIIEESLKDALAKALRREISAPDAEVDVVIDEESGEIRIYQIFTVVDDDDDLENYDQQLTLEEAQDDNPDVKIGDEVRLEHEISSLGRPAALIAKNVLRQKIREAEKQAVYDEYVNQLYEMVTVSVETVEENFVIVNLGKAFAMLPKSQQIPGEVYTEGEHIRVVITELNQESKGAQIVVSRSDDLFVRRLFEMEVPEIYQGVVEIKAIAREAGERTKVAVYSLDPDIDPIGACIGPRGSRVQEVIEELRGEKIDIFEWTDDIDQLIKSSISPAEVRYVLPAVNDRGVIVVVDDNQLSLAIGRRGMNARLAVKLTGQKIDIKSMSEMEGIDLEAESLENMTEIPYQVIEQRDPRDVLNEQLQAEQEAEEPIDLASEAVAVQEESQEPVIQEITEEEEVQEETPALQTETDEVEETKEVKETEDKDEDAAAPKVKEREVKNEYVSKFEKLADPTVELERQARKEAARARRNERKQRQQENRPWDNFDEDELEYEIKPEYTEEELAAFEEAEEDTWFDEDIDFEDFEDYYDFED